MFSPLGAEPLSDYPRYLLMEHPADPRVVLVTAPDEVEAARLARELVTSGLAACVNRVPGVMSTYRWQGEVCEDAEVLMIIKTTSACLQELEAAIHKSHPYEVPEFVALAPGHVAAPYLDWLRASVAAEEGA